MKKNKDGDKLMKEVLKCAAPEELKLLNSIKDGRLSSIDSFRGLMFKAGLTFIAISVPMYLSDSVSGNSKTAFACSLYLAIAATIMLSVLLLKEPRQKAEVFNQLVYYILNTECRSEFACEAGETWYEKICEKMWGLAACLSLIALVTAVILK